MSNVNSWFVSILPYFLVGLGFVIAFIMIQGIGINSKESAFYSRFQTCVLSVKPSVRNEDTIHDCYEKVEKETGYKAERYETKGF